jgi:hypothetical protein
LKRSAFVALFFLVATAAAAYFSPVGQKLLDGLKTTSEDREILTYVPTDTVFFFGGLEPVPFQHTLDVFASKYAGLTNREWSTSELGRTLGSPAAPPAARMLGGLLSEYMRALRDATTTGSTLGVGEQLDAAAYAVGALPVLRIKLADPAAFHAFVDSAEKTANVSAAKNNVDGLAYRAYSLDKPDARKAFGIDLVIAVHDGYAVMSLAPPYVRKQALRMVFGIDKPERSLAKAGTLKDMQTRYGYHPVSMGFISHREIMNGLTDPSANGFGRMLEQFVKASGHSNTAPSPLSKLQTPACRTELMAIADAWPRTVVGYTEYDIDQQPIKMAAQVLVEGHDTKFLQELRKIRGFVPATLQDHSSKPLAGMGIGLNVDTLAPQLTKLLQSVSSKTYQCRPLKQMQQALQQFQGAGKLAIAMAMVSGLRGISAAVMDVEGHFIPGAPRPDIQNIDGLITISAEHPRNLILAASNFLPMLGTLNLPEDGTAVDLPLPVSVPGGRVPKLAVKGKHLVAYVGPKSEAAAEKLAREALEPNGLFVFSMDYSKYMRLAMAGGAAAGTNNKPIIEAMRDFNGQVTEAFDILPEGFAFELNMTIN